MARILLGNAGPPLTIPSTSNHPFLRQGTFNKARIMTLLTSLGLFHPPGIITFMSIAPRSCWLLLASLLLFHPSGIVSPTAQLQQARVLLGVAGLPLTIPSNRNHLCLFHEALIWARIMFGVNDAHLTISSTRNNHHLLYGALTGP